MPNRLASETSPYLLQHKDNPVDWYPWGREALDKARAEDKPLLVSIGYSACHWCHVMEHESFEDPDTAAMLNEHFVAVKVDREERPDIDAIYMTALQAMGQQGGWPLNVFITHNGSPFYGGTYWPPEDRQGMPSFTRVLEAVADAYKTRRADVIESAEQLRELVRRGTQAVPRAGDLMVETLENAVEKLSRQFDGEHGGFGSAPKFPQPSILEFLLRRHRASGDERAARMARVTLDAMAAGGIYDQIGGGFHRYSVDAIWLVPHFEKMLYDNAQLARVYLDAWRLFGEPRYRRVAEETLDYTLREMTSPEGGFFATQDADTEGEEGKFYVWSPDEIDAVLGPEEGGIVRTWFGVTKRGNFEGHTILNVAQAEVEVSKAAKVTPGRLREVIDGAIPKLRAARNQRVAPGRDEKIIVSWNGMMLRAFAEASRAFGRADYRAAAVRNAEFLLGTLLAHGHLRHTYKDGQAKIDGFLEDYANLVDGLIALYEATFDRRWIDSALDLTKTVLAEFADPKGVGFFDTSEHGEELIARPRDLSDGATPAGNSVMASALLRLARMTGNRDFEARAMAILHAVAQPMVDAPVGYGRMLATAEWFLGTPREIAIAGEAGSADTEALAEAVYRRFEPFAIIGLADGTSDGMPFLVDRPMRDGRATAYLCERFACMTPVHDAVALTEQLERGTGISWQAF